MYNTADASLRYIKQRRASRINDINPCSCVAGMERHDGK